MDNLQPIGEILAKSQPGHSQVWNEEKEKTCECGSSFKDKIYHFGDKVTENTKCSVCRKKENDCIRNQEGESKLKVVIENQKELWLEDCGLPSYYWDKTFTNFDNKAQPKAVIVVKNLRWLCDDNGNPPQSLILSSPGIYGVGKTHLLAALINQIIETKTTAYLDRDFNVRKVRCPFYFTAENNLLRRIRNTFNHNSSEGQETEASVYKKLANYDLLIIDDVGKVRPKDNTFTQGVYFDLIDQRYSESKSIILTTNLDYPELEAHIGGACADRLREMCGKNFIKMTGKSYRRKDDLPVKA